MKKKKPKQDDTNIHKWFDVRLVSNAIVMVTLPRSFAGTNEQERISQESVWILMQLQNPTHVFTDRLTERQTD